MVAYSETSFFVRPIMLKEKQHTIRRPRRRHARPGEQMQFFTGPRMKPVRVGFAVCQSVREIRLNFRDDVITLDDAVEYAEMWSLNAFASRDGFGSVDAYPWLRMKRWWATVAEGRAVCNGILLEWGDTFRPERLP